MSKNINEMMNQMVINGSDEETIFTETEVKNIIGAAFGLVVTKEEIEQMTDQISEDINIGEFCYYDYLECQKENRILLNIVVDHLKQSLGPVPKKITTFPISLIPFVFRGEKQVNFVRTSLVRVKHFKEDRYVFIDRTGRRYSGMDDWLENNHLPPGEVTYPTQGQLLLTRGKKAAIETKKTPSSGWPAWMVSKLDTVVGGVNVLAAFGTLFCPMSWPLAIIIGACSVYSGAKSGYRLYDRCQHGQPLLSMEAANDWIQIASTFIVVANLGAGELLRSALNKGYESTKTALNWAITTNVLGLSSNALGVIDVVVGLIQNWSTMSKAEMIMCFIAATASLVCMCHSMKNLRNNWSVKKMFKTSQAELLDEIRNKIPDGQKKLFDQSRTKNGDSATLKLFKGLGMSSDTDFETLTKLIQINIKSNLPTNLITSQFNRKQWEETIRKKLEESNKPIRWYKKIVEKIIETDVLYDNFDDLKNVLEDVTMDVVNNVERKFQQYRNYINDQDVGLINIDEAARRHFNIPADEEPEEFFFKQELIENPKLTARGFAILLNEFVDKRFFKTIGNEKVYEFSDGNEDVDMNVLLERLRSVELKFGDSAQAGINVFQGHRQGIDTSTIIDKANEVIRDSRAEVAHQNVGRRKNVLIQFKLNSARVNVVLTRDGYAKLTRYKIDN